jgi:hypothetical protein
MSKGMQYDLALLRDFICVITVDANDGSFAYAKNDKLRQYLDDVKFTEWTVPQGNFIPFAKFSFDFMHKERKHRYLFSHIPNNKWGNCLVDKLKKWIHPDCYMRVRGQYLDHSKLDEGESWKNFQDGQPINKSKYLRLYFHRR